MDNMKIPSTFTVTVESIEDRIRLLLSQVQAKRLEGAAPLILSHLAIAIDIAFAESVGQGH